MGPWRERERRTSRRVILTMNIYLEFIQLCSSTVTYLGGGVGPCPFGLIFFPYFSAAALHDSKVN